MNLRTTRAAAAAFAAAVVCAAALVSFRATYEPDLWWHMAHGREMAAGHIVRTNLFSFTWPDYPQPYTSWLFDLGSYVLWTCLGPAAVQAAQAATVALTLWVVAAACRVRSSMAATIAVCIFGWLIIEPRALPRPHAVSFLGMALCVYWIERARELRRARPLRWMPLLSAAWANVHVECVFGVAVVGLFAIGELVQQTVRLKADATGTRTEALKVLAIAAISLGATLLTPYGFGILRYLYENAFVTQVINIAELLPPYLPAYRAFFVWAIAGGVLVMVSTRMTFADVLIVGLFAYLGFEHLRMTPLLWIVTAPLVAQSIDALKRFGIDRRAVPVTVAAAALALVRVPPGAMVHELGAGRAALMPPEFFSEPAMRFARAHGLSGPTFTSMNLGGFVAWELYPSARVFVDSRLQAYPPAHFRSVIEASKDPEAWAAMTRGVDWAVLSLPRVNELSGAGQFNEPEWASVYRDDAIELRVRRSGPYGYLAATRVAVTQSRLGEHSAHVNASSVRHVSHRSGLYGSVDSGVDHH